MIQDPTFVQSDPGHAKADTPRGDEAKTRRSKDGTWVKKGGKSYFGYKLHTIIDKDSDSQIDLSEMNEVVYRDKGYFGVGEFIEIL